MSGKCEENLSTDLGCQDQEQEDDGDDNNNKYRNYDNGQDENGNCNDACDYWGMMQITAEDGTVNTKMIKTASPAAAAACGIFGTLFVALLAYAFFLRSKQRAVINID